MFFSKKISTNSECQFKFDFGEYPPKPLSRMKVNIQFDILSMGRIGLLYKSVSQIFSLIFLTMSGKLPFHSSSQIMINMRNSRVQIRKEVLKIKTDVIKNATQFKNSPFQVNFVLFVVFLVVFSPLLLLFILLFIVFLLAYLLKKMASLPIHKSLGFFQSFTNIPSEIVF